jgi:hypothetical protein
MDIGMWISVVKEARETSFWFIEQCSFHAVSFHENSAMAGCFLLCVCVCVCVRVFMWICSHALLLNAQLTHLHYNNSSFLDNCSVLRGYKNSANFFTALCSFSVRSQWLLVTDEIIWFQCTPYFWQEIKPLMLETF